MPVFFCNYSKPCFVWHFSKENPGPDVLWARADKPISVHVPVEVGGCQISFALTTGWATFMKSCLYTKQQINVYKDVFKYKTGWKGLVGERIKKSMAQVAQIEVLRRYLYHWYPDLLIPSKYMLGVEESPSRNSSCWDILSAIFRTLWKIKLS